MDPSPLIPIALVFACGLTALGSCWSSTSMRHPAAIGAIATPILALVIPPIGLAWLMIARDNGWEWTLKSVFTTGVGMGLISAALAVPCGLGAGLVGRGLSQLLFPIGAVRERSESLASMSRRLGGAMTLSKAMFTVVVSVLVLAALGGVIGFALGTFVPGYYRHLFPKGHAPEFDPVGMGIGLGVGQGAVGGVVVGTVLVGILAWYDLRRARC